VSRTRILLVSRSNAIASEIAEQLRNNARFKLSTKIVSNGHLDPLQDVTTLPDVVLLHCIAGYGELQHLAETRKLNRLPLIVLGPGDNPDAIRLAMRAGASDYLTSPIQQAELLAALDRISGQVESAKQKSGELVTVVNSRGGSGASFLAANIAYGFHNVDKVKSLLVDLDLQFGGLSRYFDVNPKRGIIDALEAVDDMDEVSAQTYITRHKSGLPMLAACTDSLSISNEVSVERIDLLLRMFLQHNEFVVVDLPRRIDLIGATVLESSDRVLLVVQQSLSHIHDALRMTRLIIHELGVPRDRVTVVLNRYNKKALIEKSDILEALKVEELFEVPNQYDLVSESIDAGKPVQRSAKISPVARAISELQAHIRGVESPLASQSILKRAIPSILRRAH